MARRTRSRQAGFLLLVNYVLITFLLVWVATGLRQSFVNHAASERFADISAAFSAAESGLDAAHRWLRSQGSPPAGILPFDPFNGVVQLPGGQFQATIDPADTNPATYLDEFTLTATGQAAGIWLSRRVSLLVRAESFARFSYFTNFERLADGRAIWFTSRDVLTGPVHSNDRFNIAGSPTFNGPVTSAVGTINYQNPPPTGGNNPQFNGGLQLNAANITMPTSATTLRVAAQAAGGAYFTGNTTIVLQANGTMLVTNPVLGWTNQVRALPANGALFVTGGNLTVSGTLNGSLSMGTSEDLILAGHVRYADNPRVNPNSDDLLGLVAERNVIIPTTAPSNLFIDATMMAMNSSFTVADWWSTPVRGTLNVYGGIIQQRRGAVGTFDASTGLVTHGYIKNYAYDTRLVSMTPPHYPTSGLYRTLLWREEK